MARRARRTTRRQTRRRTARTRMTRTRRTSATRAKTRGRAVQRVSQRRTVRRTRAVRARTAGRRTAARRPMVSARQVREVAQQVSRPAAVVQKQEPQGTFIGTIQHYYTHLSVGIFEVQEGEVKVGDNIRIKGATTDFTQTVQSMQLEHQQVERATKGQSVGLKVEQHVRQHDKVYKI